MNGRLRRLTGGLAFRIAALFALALLPIGIIAVLQNARLVEAVESRHRANLLALTSESAAGEEAVLRTAFGAAQTIASFVPNVRDNLDLCNEVLGSYVRRSGSFTFAGYVDTEALFACSSADRENIPANPGLFATMQNDPAARIVTIPSQLGTGEPVVVLALPLLDADGIFDGYVVVSVPHSILNLNFDETAAERPIDLALFNIAGELIASESGQTDDLSWLPRDRDLRSFIGQRQVAFNDENRRGDISTYSVVPVIPGLVYAIGSWEPERVTSPIFLMAVIGPVLFPILMWLVSLGVAFLAVRKLVIEPTRNLRARMLVFMRTRMVSQPRSDLSVPNEIRDIDETWQRLAESVLREEAELEDAVREKSVLVKEVHHRVKNNLQIIISILNMKIRSARTKEGRLALTDIQNRVMSLAAVHQSLHQTESMGSVEADVLLRSIVAHVASASQVPGKMFEVREDYEPLVLYPDQAVPLALLVSEAITNAVKYMGQGPTGTEWVALRLSQSEEDIARVEIANSLPSGEPAGDADDPAGTGLGSELLRAFVGQLDGQLHVAREDDAYKLVVTFPINTLKQAAANAI